MLKALYLQQHFVDFAIRNQGVSDQELYENFDSFVGTHGPHDLEGPTQSPGVIRANN